MRKFILIGLAVGLGMQSSIFAGSDTVHYYDDSKDVVINVRDPKNGLEYLAGKIIYRDVPAKNAIEYDESYIGNNYKLVCYNSVIMQIKSVGFLGKDGKVFGEHVYTLSRNLWDDGNWKEWTEAQAIKKTLSSEKLNSVKKRLICTKLIDSETFHMSSGGRSKYSCVDCGHWLKEGAATNYYYCPMCYEGFCIEEKEVAVLSTKKQNGVVAYETVVFHLDELFPYRKK